LNKEPPPVASVTNDNKGEDEDEDDWEKLLDNDDNLLTNDLVEEVNFEIFSFIFLFVFFKRFKQNLKTISR
jgi:hypothetical protein